MSRSPGEVSRLFAYNRWANARTLQSVSALSAEEFDRQLGGSFASVHETLAHIYAAEWIWLERWQGRSPRALPSAQEVPTLHVLQEKWRGVENGQREFIEGLTEAGMARVLSYVNVKGETWAYPVGDMLVHVANHSTYHRGQVATMLRQLGKVALATDYLVFFDEGGAR